MKQFIIKKDSIIKNKISLKEQDFNYLINVRRYKIGDEIKAIDEQGNTYKLRLTVISKNTCSLNVIETTETKKIQGPKIVLIQCLPKGKKIDTIVRQATETGVNSIIPIISEYSIAIPEEKAFSKKKERWNKICNQAIQQSGSSTITKVEDILNFEELMKYIKNNETGNSIKIFCHHIESENSTSFHSALSKESDKIFLIIGAEGGISEKEVNLLIKNGFKSIHFGQNILRCETAPVYALGAIKTILKEKK